VYRPGLVDGRAVRVAVSLTLYFTTTIRRQD